MLEPYEKSLIRGSYRLARRGSRKSRESAKEQALRMFVGWAWKNSGKEVSEARVREAAAYLDDLARAEEKGDSDDRVNHARSGNPRGLLRTP